MSVDGCGARCFGAGRVWGKSVGWEEFVVGRAWTDINTGEYGLGRVRVQRSQLTHFA